MTLRGPEEERGGIVGQRQYRGWKDWWNTIYLNVFMTNGYRIVWVFIVIITTDSEEWTLIWAGLTVPVFNETFIKYCTNTVTTSAQTVLLSLCTIYSIFIIQCDFLCLDQCVSMAADILRCLNKLARLCVFAGNAPWSSEILLIQNLSEYQHNLMILVWWAHTKQQTETLHHTRQPPRDIK